MKIDAMLYMGGTWGNAVHFLDDKSTDRIYGWKPNYFRHAIVIDLCHHVDEPDTPIYETTSVEWKDNPRDMFFADVGRIGTIPTEVARKGGQVTQDAVMAVYEQVRRSRKGWLRRLFARRGKKD